MLTPVVWSAVQTLFNADSGAGGLTTLVTAMNTEDMKETASLPYIHCTSQDDSESDTFSANMSDIRFAFNVYVARAQGPVGSSVRSITARLRTVYHRVTSASVSYGGTNYLVRFRRVGGVYVPEDTTVFHQAEQYAAMVVTA